MEGMMLDVNIEKILPVTEVRDSLNKIIDEVEATDELYVITKNGKPSAIIVGVHHLEKLTGISHKELMPDEGKTAGASDATQSSTPPASSTTDDLFGDAASPAETISASEPPPADLSIDTNAQAPMASQAPTPDNLAPIVPAPEAPVAPDVTAPIASADNATPTGINNTFATPDSAALSNADDLFGPPAETTPATPLTVPTDPNLASAPTADPADANQPQNQTPPVAPTQM